MSTREDRRLALQSTAELWRGLDILDAELRAGRFSSARETVAMMRTVVKMADSLLVQYLRDVPLLGDGGERAPDGRPTVIGERNRTDA